MRGALLGGMLQALRQLEATLVTTLLLLSKAAGTLVMILWNHALSKLIVVDLSDDDLATVGARLWLLWAFSLTTGLAFVAVRPRTPS